MVPPVALRVLQIQVVHHLESLLAGIQGSPLAAQARQHQQRAHSGQPVSLSQLAYLCPAQQPLLVELCQHLLVHLRLIVQTGRLVEGRLLSMIQCVCHGRWSDQGYASPLTQRVLALSYPVLIVLLLWACALPDGIPQCRQGQDSYAVAILASDNPHHPLTLPYRMLAFAQSSVVHRSELPSSDS